MTPEVYNLVTKLQDTVTEQSNILADVIQQLNDLALIYESAVKETHEN